MSVALFTMRFIEIFPNNGAVGEVHKFTNKNFNELKTTFLVDSSKNPFQAVLFQSITGSTLPQKYNPTVNLS